MNHQEILAKLPIWAHEVRDVLEERIRQEVQWGTQDHSPQDWMMILMEEVGEFARAEMETREREADPANIREELVQVAAVALAMLECCYRNGWHK